MLSRRYATARSALDSRRQSAVTAYSPRPTPEELMLLVKAKLLDVADRLHEMQFLLQVTSREDADTLENEDRRISASSEPLSYTLSNFAEEALSLSPLSADSLSPGDDHEKDLQGLLQPAPTGLMSIPDLEYITTQETSLGQATTAQHPSARERKRSTVVFLPIVEARRNQFEGLRVDKDFLQTQRTADDAHSSPGSVGGWSDESPLALDEKVRASRPKGRRGFFGRCCHESRQDCASSSDPDKMMAGLAAERMRTLMDSPEDDRGEAREPRRWTRDQEEEMRQSADICWNDEPSFLLQENVSEAKRTGKRVKVPPLELGALPPSPLLVEAAPMKSSFRHLGFASARSSESMVPPSSIQAILSLSESLDQLSLELMENAQGSRVFADTMHAKVLRLTDDVSRARTRYTDLVSQLEDVERSLNASLVPLKPTRELKTPSMSPTPQESIRGRPHMGRRVDRVVVPSELSPSSATLMKSHTRDNSNLTTRANSPCGQQMPKLMDNGNDPRTPAPFLLSEVGTGMTPRVLKDGSTSPAFQLQRDFACLAKPPRFWRGQTVREVAVRTSPKRPAGSRQWCRPRQTDIVPTKRRRLESHCSWEWFKTFLLRATPPGTIGSCTAYGRPPPGDF